MTVRTQLASATLAVALAAVLCASLARAADPAPAAPQSTGKVREASLAEYRQHLVDLSAVVAACTGARDTKTCNPTLAGQDDHVPLGNAPNAERRPVRYDWLRTLLAKGQEKDQPPEKAEETSPDKSQGKTQDKAPDKTSGTPVAGPVVAVKQDQAEEPTRPPEPTTPQLLQAAQTRLAQDLAQADAAATAPSAVAANYAPERETMKQVLAQRDFRNLEAPTARDSALEKLGDWLNRLWASAAKLQGQAAWVGRVIVGAFILAVCVELVWGLMQLERRWRIRLVPEIDAPAAAAASARDWQLWLNDARRSAAAGQWREAVHFVYWAAISRLESKRLWPADRARTPREYLALVAAEDPRRAALATLTGSFERTWYGGRAAAESDYQKAEELAAALIASSGVAPSGSASARPAQGGAR